MLKYEGYQVVFQEVPDEISLAFNITGCPYRCEGCHSKYMWDDTGHSLKKECIQIIAKHIDEISCVCFMGGDHESDELLEIIDSINKSFPELKICLYSGNDALPIELLQRLDYVKIGHYDDNLGGLNKKTTNQRMFKITGVFQDITYKFQRIEHEN